MPSKEVVDATISLADDQLLREAFGRSPAELEILTGIPAERAIARVKWLLQQRDIYTAVEQEQFIFQDLISLKKRVEKLLDSESTKLDARLYKVMLETLSKLGERLDIRAARNSNELEIVSQATRRALRDMLSSAYYPAREATERHFGTELLTAADVFDHFEPVFQRELRNQALDNDMKDL